MRALPKLATLAADEERPSGGFAAATTGGIGGSSETPRKI
jgi:hypothetical protein